MQLMSADRFRRLTIATALAASAALLLLIGFQFLPALLSSNKTLIPAMSIPATAPNSLELSVFDQPRDLPAISFTDAEGRALTLADFPGKVVLLNIWATWCVPCRKEMPALDRLQAQLGGDDFLVLPLSIDRAGMPAVKRFYEELGLKSLAIYLDTAGAAPRAFGAPGVPTTLLIGRDGREVARKMGAAEWDGPEMVALIRSYIDARTVPAKGAKP